MYIDVKNGWPFSFNSQQRSLDLLFNFFSWPTKTQRWAWGLGCEHMYMIPFDQEQS